MINFLIIDLINLLLLDKMNLTIYNILFLFFITSQMASCAYYNKKGLSHQALYPSSPYNNLVWIPTDEFYNDINPKFYKNIKKWSKLEPSVRFGDGGSSLNLY
uniref:Uncharacterized protein n=1 Tax=Strongyloides stercoralis TaxID=6248 RepID=A0A0K0EQC6_STRER